MRQYIGDLKEYLIVQYAKSKRSKCRKCKQNINKNQLRVGLAFDSQRFSSFNWFHLQCFQFKPRHKVIKIKQLQKYVQGINQIQQKDYKNLIKTLKNNLNQLQHKQSKSKSKQKTAKRQKQKSPQKIPKNQLAQQKKKQAKKLIKSKHKVVQGQLLTQKQKQEYQKLIQEYKTYPTKQLKNILRINQQVKVGNHQELAARCADGKQFGRIPNCPKCGGGKLKFDRQKRIYHCPGYMQDTDFVACDAKFNFKDVKRPAWIE